MRRWAWGLLALTLVCAGLLAPSTTPVEARAAMWTTLVFSKVPAPGHPAYVFAHRNGRIYAGSYISGDQQRSKVYEWRADGTLLRSWTVPRQRLDVDHGVQVANQTRAGLLVLLEISTRTVQTLNLKTGRFKVVATLPAGSTPNYAAWGARNLFVTDYARGIIWRVYRSGRVQKFAQRPELEGVGGFGTTGIVYRPRKHDFLITQQTTAAFGTPSRGHLYRLPVRRGRAGAITRLWTSRDTDLPDGFGIGRSGRIYIANAGLTNQIVQLSPTGVELTRFPEAPFGGANGSPVPFDTPCSATFFGTKILVANQAAVSGDASHMAILSVEVGERGRRPHLPRSARFAR